MEITLELEATDTKALMSDIFDEDDPRDGAEVRISDDISLHYYEEDQRDFGLTALVILLLNVPIGVAINVVTERITNHLRCNDRQGRVKSAMITYTEEINGRKRTVEKRIEIDGS
ncbi:hypothetical protein PV355_05535 [Streptomyces stelliscabiei]|uniref:hypothetical protein n=1 Tax=Streptomyces stelliscabiei TaxID=146820 RepID=UPI0029BE174D|nr:hypothetical protein [Streptomyces stelliscabiei]MDX2514608.1 hypothetical protein [Streptomyces stelliscabiei]